MSLEGFLTALFVLFAVLFQIAAALAGRAKKRGTPLVKQGLLGTIVERIKKDLEAAAAAARQGGEGSFSGWEDLMADEPAGHGAGQQEAPGAVFEKNETGEASPRRVSDDAARGVEEEVFEDTGSYEAQKESEQAASGAILSDGGGAGASTEELRRAVVWSEILAPPLALREDWQPGD